MQRLKRFNELNEDADTGFSRWQDALKKYKEASAKSAHDAELSAIFKGSKLTSRFIFRSISAQKQSLYDKDCQEYGKTRVDDLVDKVLNIIK